MIEISRIQWPEDLDWQSFPIHTYNQIWTPMAVEALWTKLIDAPSWPAWYDNCKWLKIVAGPDEKTLAPKTKFVWKTFGLTVISTVIDFHPLESLGWDAQEILGWRGYHGWKFVPQNGGTTIFTEEVQAGPGAWLVKNYISKMLTKQHQIWLERLAGTEPGRLGKNTAR